MGIPLRAIRAFNLFDLDFIYLASKVLSLLHDIKFTLTKSTSLSYFSA